MQITIGLMEFIGLLSGLGSITISVVVWLVRQEGKSIRRHEIAMSAISTEKNAREADLRVAEVVRKADVEAVNAKLGHLSLACSEGRRDHGNRILELETLVGRRATIFREEGK